MDQPKTGYATIDDYISGFPDEIQKKLQEIRAVIKEAAPEATEKISYQMPTFYLNGNLVHFAAFKNHIGFFPAPSGLEAFKDEISKYPHSKGGVQFPFDQPIPFDLIRRIVIYRMVENQKKAAGKKK
ncbi:iron chaperone [Leptolinea tardivitalis]|uniref:YdhG-like domain-containing protein n=1 Tax=Leptolinea tardivitalis TaxID=229920 RepID=A0A0P6X1Y8_9CHLR|nr:DUF1801 domain-containing protein [Leptolinea tardivitalis]KPL73315.1 hypothetical protein ADM99_03615 [Leptolinea tardivitalis]GAP21447.1 uncharacterized conserved protein [Leptolinea tardivitalis]